MNSSLPATKADAIGVLILEEFACFQAEQVIEFISQSKEIPRLYLRWLDSKTRSEEGFYSQYGRCDLVVRGKSIDLHLHGLPTSLLPDFNIGDLILPVEIRGCLLLASQEIDPATWRKDRFPGWLTWTQAQKMPYLVAVTGSDSPVLPVNEFLSHLSLKPETQVVELPSHHVGTSNLDHVFEMADVKRVLTMLVENILANMTRPPG
jgi:hypothetical protein